MATLKSWDNSFAPWTVDLFRHDNHPAFYAFWTTVLVLHWTSVGLAAVILRRAGIGLPALGIGSARRLAVFTAAAAGVGVSAVVVRATFGPLDALGIGNTVVNFLFGSAAPATTQERLFWVVLGVLTAAIAEELVYRGFGIRALKSRGYAMPVVLALTTVAWILLHGLGGVFGFPAYLIIGLGFATLYVGTGNLIVVMAVHSLAHVAVILAS